MDSTNLGREIFGRKIDLDGTVFEPDGCVGVGRPIKGGGYRREFLHRLRHMVRPQLPEDDRTVRTCGRQNRQTRTPGSDANVRGTAMTQNSS